MTKEKLKAYEERLKPCPFCGTKAKFYASANGMGYNASCRNTKCRILVITESFDSPEEAIKVWNKRGKADAILQ
ncbi:MAG: Lar family restriction alleviation protein [Clostridiales bacterium]|nr:Lar family restriction alleviation protein [Clostridiales bacterium]